MGLFGFKNKYDISPKEKNLHGIVSTYMVGGAIKINARLVVPIGYIAVIGKNGKVLDKFEEGEHFFNFSNLPMMCRKYKIDRIEDGKQKSVFNADLYYISKSTFSGKFKTYRKVEMGTKAYGKFKAHVFGEYIYKVNDPKEFMQSLLNEYDYIKTGESENIIESWVNEVIVSELEKQNFIINDVIANNPIIANALKLRISKMFAIAGLELLELKITKYKLPKKYQEQYEGNLKNTQTEPQTNNNLSENEDGVILQNAQTQETQNAITEKQDNGIIQENQKQENHKQQYYQYESIEGDVADANNLLEEFKIGTKEEKRSKEIGLQENKKEEALLQKEDNYTTSKQDEYVPFGNILIEETTLENIKENEIQEKTFVDLNLNELYNSESKNIKRCLNCGAENINSANHCIICGENFTEIDF